MIDLLGAERGDLDLEHEALLLQRWCAPLEVRMAGESTWQRFLPEARLWLPGDEQRNEWRGVVRNQFVVLPVPAVERLLEQPYHATRLAAWRGRHFDTPALASLLAGMMGTAGADQQLHQQDLLVRLLGWLAGGPDAKPVSGSLRLPPARVAALKDYIEVHLTEPLSLPGLAAVAGCSPRLLGSLFKAATGRSPYQYVLERRIAEAERLLARGHPISEVAQQLGFADQSQFSKTFRRHAGATPGEFRRNGLRVISATSAA